MIIAIANQKGGVGKTTTAVNLATALAAIGKRVLVVDSDPQGNASTGLGLDRKGREPSLYEVLIGTTTAAEALRQTPVPGLSLIPATSSLAAAGLIIYFNIKRHFIMMQKIVDSNMKALLWLKLS
jgi:chromosome partitioning protein